MIELPFDPYDSPPAPSHRREPLPASSGKDDLLEIVRWQLKAWFFGWLFYCFGLMLVLAMAVGAFRQAAFTDTLAAGLFFFCGWIAAVLQYRFPIGGPRAAPTRAEKRRATLGPNYKIGKILLTVGVMFGATAMTLSIMLETAVGDGGTIGLIALVVGQALAAGCIFLGRRMMTNAERDAVVAPPAQDS